jgi:hypothetical protein
MGGKIEQCVCIKLCMKVGKSAIETIDMIRQECGEHSLAGRRF